MEKEQSKSWHKRCKDWIVSTQAILVLILFTTVFIFFDYLDISYWGCWETWLILFLQISKPIGYFSISVLFTVLIYFKQEQSQNTENELQQKRLEQIRNAINELDPIVGVKEIQKELENWIKKDEKSTFIFYFPFSIYPGFWVDGGISFQEFMSKIASKNSNSIKDKFIFIGPALDDSFFSIINEKVIKNEGLKLKGNESGFLKGFMDKYDIDDISTPEKKIELHNSVKAEYSSKLDELKQLEKTKKFIFVKELTKVDSSKLPIASFVLKINKKQDNVQNDLFYIDTFSFLGKNVKSIIESVDCINYCNFGELETVIRKPEFAYTIKNNIIATLIRNILVENFCKVESLKELKDNI